LHKDEIQLRLIVRNSYDRAVTESEPLVPPTDQPRELLVQASDLHKTYPGRRGSPGFTAVDGIDFELRRGEAFGFLGPNGAGKSSTMRMISCISPTTSGTLRVLDMDPMTQGDQIRARLGVVPQDDCLDRELTVMENLLIYGRYFGIKRSVIRERATGLLDFAQLVSKADEQVSALSGGMRRRLTIARSLINNPEILLLDEPTTGLDPQARHVLWDRLFRLKQDGVTLILTTHYMDEAEQLCDRLVVMDHGKIVAAGSPRELIDAHATREVVELRFAIGQQSSAAEKIRGSAISNANRVEELPDRILLYADDGEAALAGVHGMRLAPITALVRRSTLEDVFLKLTGHSLIE
jgi:lipooligosaccharide transport system ATP-binding protein